MMSTNQQVVIESKNQDVLIERQQQDVDKQQTKQLLMNKARIVHIIGARGTEKTTIARHLTKSFSDRFFIGVDVSESVTSAMTRINDTDIKKIASSSSNRVFVIEADDIKNENIRWLLQESNETCCVMSQSPFMQVDADVVILTGKPFGESFVKKMYHKYGYSSAVDQSSFEARWKSVGDYGALIIDMRARSIDTKFTTGKFDETEFKIYHNDTTRKPANMRDELLDKWVYYIAGHDAERVTLTFLQRLVPVDVIVVSDSPTQYDKTKGQFRYFKSSDPLPDDITYHILVLNNVKKFTKQHKTLLHNARHYKLQVLIVDNATTTTCLMTPLIRSSVDVVTLTHAPHGVSYDMMQKLSSLFTNLSVNQLSRVWTDAVQHENEFLMIVDNKQYQLMIDNDGVWNVTPVINGAWYVSPAVRVDDQRPLHALHDSVAMILARIKTDVQLLEQMI